MQKRDSGSENEAFISLKSLFFVGGALIWAANQNWLQMAQFYDEFLVLWRDFIRALWSEFFSLLHLPFDLRGYQKDILSIIAVLLGSAVTRAFFKKPPPTLFKKNLLRIRKEAEEKYKRASFYHSLLRVTHRALLSVHIIAAGSILYFLLILPFLDTFEFTHEFKFLLFAAIVFYTIIVSILLIAISILIWRKIDTISAKAIRAKVIYIQELFKKTWKYIRRGGWKNIFSHRFRSIFILYLVNMGLIIIVVKVYQIFGHERIKQYFTKSIDHSKFNPAEYVMSILNGDYIDLLLIILCFVTLFFASGRSLRPIAQFVTIGLIIVAIGVASRAVLKISPSLNEQTAQTVVHAESWTSPISLADIFETLVDSQQSSAVNCTQKE
ncbi:hypothetical protein [Henriciella marina]|uniref:hypothetical protein n=1 Tax=Henriciella marina TaxID=453851 RepID=UPI00037B34EC|nr:hypothetical protein [Henriciella marina]